MKPLFDRSLLVSSRKDVRTDLALKYAKQELAGESNLVMPSAKRQELSASSEKQRVLPPLIEEIAALQAKGHFPIIIVPSVSSSRSRLTVLNAVKFLRDGVFEEPNGRTMTRQEGPIERSVCGRNLSFRICDDTSKFRKDDWKAVVAVFTEGKMWQFSGWPFRAESDLFTSVQAFNLRYSDDQSTEPLITSGRVKSLILKRSARHQDSAVMIEFWKAMESFLNQVRVRKFSQSSRLP